MKFFKWMAKKSKGAPAQTEPKAAGSCGNCGCGSSLGDKKLSRRGMLGAMATATAASAAAAMKATDPMVSAEEFAATKLAWQEYFKGNFREMTPDERRATVERLERLANLRGQGSPQISAQGPRDNVLYGYAFNISKCQGYMDCVKACVEENNLDRDTAMQYIRVFELKNGNAQLESANGRIAHDVPVEGHYYFATQCFHCENPPCVDVCPVGATWKEKDGIVVIDYDWCVGCRYCEAACPYWGRRFNWKEPRVEKFELNLEQHYLGNRPRTKGVMEKCTFCIQRSREGRQPACVEACPTGARIFGNLLDPSSEIRWVLANKKVFRLKEDLGTEPKFWYFTD